MKAIMKRDLRSFFTGPIGYIFCSSFFLAMALIFYIYHLSANNGELAGLFQKMILSLIILMPLLTMRLISEEKKMKTEQILLTSPVSLYDIVVGKFIATFLVFMVALVLTIIFPIITAFYCKLSFMYVLGNYVAAILAASTFIAIGIFVSSLTENQLIAAILSIIALGFMYLLDTITSLIDSPFVVKVLNFVSVFSRFSGLQSGVFPLSDIIYYISLTCLFLFFTVRVYEKRRWA